MKLLSSAVIVLVLTVASIHGDPASDSPVVTTLTDNSSVTFFSTETTSTTLTSTTSTSNGSLVTATPLPTTSLVTATPLPTTSLVTATSLLSVSSNGVNATTTSKPPNATTSILSSTNSTSSPMNSTPSPSNTTSVYKTSSPHTNNPTTSSPILTSPPTSQPHVPTSSTHSNGPTPPANVGKECTTSLAIAVGVSIPGTAIVTFFFTSLACLCCQKVKKRSYIRLTPTVYFDDEEDQD